MLHSKGHNMKNIELNDKYNFQDVKVNKNVLYNGDCTTLFDTKHEYAEANQKPLAAAVLGLNNTNIPLPDDLRFSNIWTDMDAQEAYLKQKPATFLILGKQGTGTYTLGEAMSKKFNCIHLCPKNVLLDEIEQKSSTGKCLDFNMRHNKVCKFDIILSIMKKKLQSPAILHRGFVISGIPLTTSSQNIQYFISSFYSEESLVVIENILQDLVLNLKKKKQKSKKSVSHSSTSSDVDIDVEEEDIEEEQETKLETEEFEEQIVALPKFLMESCHGLISHIKPYFSTTKIVLLQQVQELFGLNPDVVVYISCPNLDIVTKRSRRYLNYLSSSSTFFSFPINIDNEERWPINYNMGTFQKPYDSHIFNPKYNCRQPINFKVNIQNQLCNIKYSITPFIESKLNDFDAKKIIKLDGRTSVHQMIHITTETILLMSIKPIIIPEPLYLDDPPDDIEEFWNVVEQLNVIRSGILKFNRYASFWYNRCPVELTKRKSTIGNPKFAVTFFKYIYLCSSLETMIMFCRNPRPYLKLEFLKPTCRVVVLGTKLSGKTMVSSCLSWLFDTPTICFNSLFEKEKKKKYDIYAKNILSEIIPKIEDTRYNKWQNMETERISKLNTWFNTYYSILNKYVPLLKQNLRHSEEDDKDFSFNKKLTTLKNQLSFLPVDDLQRCEDLLKNKSLMALAPAELITELSKPTVPNLGDEDVNEEISAYIMSNNLQKEMEPTSEEIMTEINNILTCLDSEALAADKIYGNFIIDGFPPNIEYWSYFVESNLLPDHVISLIENKEIDHELIRHYTKIENCTKNHQERFLLSDDAMIKTKLTKCKPANTSYLDIKILVEQIVTNILKTLLTVEDNDVENINDNNLLTSLTENIEKFREEWDILKPKLDEHKRSYLEIELEEKTDIEVLNEVLLKLRKSYCKHAANIEETFEDQDENDSARDILSYNYPVFLGETNIYCPVAFYDHNILWEGKFEFSTTHDNKIYYSCSEDFRNILQYDITKYQMYCKPIKNVPPVRICVIGSIGSGRTSISNVIAKELGLLHIDISDYINDFVIPKHFKKVGWQFENSFTDTDVIEEDLLEFQVDEENLNLLDIISNEKELRCMIHNYLERGIPLPFILIEEMLKKLWHQVPYSSTGLIIDGFPKLPSDVDVMIKNMCIPDLVINLESNSEIAIERLSQKMLNKWKINLIEAKTKAHQKLEIARSDWKKFITKTVVVKLTIDEIFENIFHDIEIPLKSSSIHSTIIDADPEGLPNIDANLFTTYNELILEFPEPIDENEWEKSDDVLEKINNRLESIFDIDDENIQALTDILYENKIKTVSLDGKKKLGKVLRNVLIKLCDLRNRSESFLEQTFIVNCDIAEMLLWEGFYLLSKFNRMCPVYILENPYALQNLYHINRQKNKIFPIIHRPYIYFLSSEENVNKFRNNPLKYIQGDTIKLFQTYPLRISVIGPPKSGKSKLSAHIAKQYGLMCISRGMAIRNILENMHWTVLGLKIAAQLREGNLVNNDLIMKAIATIAIDNRVMSNGFVLDGFPETLYEISELSKLGLTPSLILDINADSKVTIKNSQCEVYTDILKYKPAFSKSLIECRYNKWYTKSSIIRDFINEDLQNIFVINGNNSKWQCFIDANMKISDLTPKIHNFLTYSKSKIVRADVMCISNEVFQQKMSCFKNLCPVCFHKNILRHSGYPVDKTGLVQYKDLLYWICPKHINIVLLYPEKFLWQKRINIPEIPVVVKSISTSLVYENGICIVTYAENLPSQRIVKGNNSFASIYKCKTYLFCSSQCLNKFLAKPHLYYSITVYKESNIFPEINLKNISHLGFLEQSVGNIITEACCALNISRPKYPGLDTSLSAVIFIALYLKTHNNLLDKSMQSKYENVFKSFEARCRLVKDIGQKLRSTVNPFAYYPKCCNKIAVKQAVSNIFWNPSSNASSITTNPNVESKFYLE